MTQINTNGIDTNYPVPGQNNSSQGFRDNFSQIKTNLNTAGTEITDLQNKVVVKAALTDTSINNDMANTLISNCATQGFRATTYNLGNALSGTVLVNVNRADVQYGSVASNVILQFSGWSPTNTESNVVLRLNISNANASISLPSQCVSSNNNFGVVLLENYANVSNVAVITAPSNVSVLEYTFSSIDCGNSITVEPTNRPYQSTQVVTRNPPPTGQPGDVSGTISVSSAVDQINATTTANIPTVITSNTFSATSSNISGTTFNVGSLTGTIAVGMILSGTGVTANTYVVSGAGSTWTVSQSSTTGSSITITGASGIITAANSLPILTVGVQTSGTVQPGMILSGSGVTANTFIVKNLSGSGSGSRWQVSAAQYAAPTTINGAIDVMTVNSTANFYRDMPITFVGNTYGNITSGNTYYVKEIASNTAITLADTAGGAMHVLSNNTGNTMHANPAAYAYVATDSFNATIYTKDTANTFATTNTVKFSSSANLSSVTVGSPIIFTGNVFGGLVANTVYYVKTVDAGNSNVTISQTRVNGVPGSDVLLDTVAGNCAATIYVGNDIWRRIPLSSW